LHEASIIATKERAEMKMIEVFIAKRAGIVGDIGVTVGRSRNQFSFERDPKRRDKGSLIRQ
jgi:hypothetical protein